ncbi:MAG: TorF family putative porin [Thauera sp.]|nr:TorF family putative porin [Thauera sp.]
MKKTIVASALLALSATSAFAQDAAPASPHSVTGNVTLASEYIYRGIGQTNREPAIQGGFDYAHSSGFYLGTWASSISWLSDGRSDVSSSVEVDIYGGFKNTFGGGDWNYDVGVLTYNYPGSYPGDGYVKPDTTELYGAIGWKWLSFKYSHTVSSHIFGFTGSNGEKTRGSAYYELNASYDLGDGWGVLGHLGHQKIRHNGDASYTDWKLGVTKDLGVGVIGLSYIDTDAKACGDAVPVYCNAFNKDLGKGRAHLSFTKTF